MKKYLTLSSIALLLSGCSIIDSSINGHFDNDVPEIPEETKAFHQTLEIVDMHSDALMWRDITADKSQGHVSTRRLSEGNVAIQVLAMNSILSISRNDEGRFERATCGADPISLKLMLDTGDISFWTADDCYGHLKEQSQRFQDALVDEKNYNLTQIKTSTDIDNLLKNRTDKDIGLLLSIEGAHGMGADDIDATTATQRLEQLYTEDGVRMLGLTHMFDNAFAGSSNGIEAGGLTDIGVATVEKAFELGVAVDVAHSSRITERETAKLAFINKKPIVVSHTGLNGTREDPRNISDENLKHIALTDGVVGLGFWSFVLPETEDESFENMLNLLVRNFEHAAKVLDSEDMHCAAKLMGKNNYNPYNYIGLGSDYDGLTKVVVRPHNLNQLTDGLLKAGISEQNVRKIMGENTIRALKEALHGEAISDSEKADRKVLYNQVINQCFK